MTAPVRSGSAQPGVGLARLPAADARQTALRQPSAWTTVVGIASSPRSHSLELSYPQLSTTCDSPDLASPCLIDVLCFVLLLRLRSAPYGSHESVTTSHPDVRCLRAVPGGCST